MRGLGADIDLCYSYCFVWVQWAMLVETAVHKGIVQNWRTLFCYCVNTVLECARVSKAERPPHRAALC